MISLKKLIDAGVQFGHVVSKWNPNMNRYIWGVRNKVHLIDISKTAVQLERAATFLESLAAEGKQILWAGTKKPAQDIIRETAKKVDMPFVDHRWVGGTLSNYAQVKKAVTRLLHLEDIIVKAEKFPHYTKKELALTQKVSGRLAKIVGGLKKMQWPVSAVVLVDTGKMDAALKEAVRVGIPVIAIIDTNNDPSLVDYPIPANDDAESSISLIVSYLGEAVARGLAQAEASGKRKVIAEPTISDEAPLTQINLDELTEEEDGAKGTPKKGVPGASPATRKPALRKSGPRPGGSGKKN